VAGIRKILAIGGVAAVVLIVIFLLVAHGRHTGTTSPGGGYFPGGGDQVPITHIAPREHGHLWDDQSGPATTTDVPQPQ
jgi:hypothetical protein